jgi:CDP-ribitol ribitolphosphotransferase
MFKQLWCIAGAQVVVLDGYCLVVSLLSHRSTLRVIQIWHAMGTLKKYGLAALGRPGGRSRQTAELLHMHQGYSLVLASSKACIPSVMEAFGYPREQVICAPLPHAWSLAELPPKTRTGKLQVLYAPTFRLQGERLQRALERLCACFDFEHMDLTLSAHPLSKLDPPDPRVRVSRQSTIQAASQADLCVVDYSAVMFDLMLMHKPLYFYTFDLTEYLQERDFFIDFVAEAPGPLYPDATSVVAAICADTADTTLQQAFLKRYVDLDRPFPALL